jgi:Xaa-Pro aminopeptidase
MTSPAGRSASQRPMRLLVCTLLALVFAGAAHASEFTDDLAARRARVAERLAPDSMLLLWSAPERQYSRDVDYEYRQDSNLYYLTGITQSGTMLVLMPGNQSRREILFVQDRNPAQEHWTGQLLSAEQARLQSGVETVLVSSQFEPFVAAMLARRAYGPIDARQAARFFEALSGGRARVQVVLEDGQSISSPLTPPLEFVRKIRERFVGFDVTDAAGVFADLRTVKTPYERSVLARSLDISVDAQKAGMRAAHPGAWEYEVKAAIEAVHRGRGAPSPAYPSIVGSGPDATILHYQGGDRQMQAGELLLVDAACNYGYMAGDITRTYPVSGTFSPAQKDIYQLVLQAQTEAMKAARPGATLQDVHRRAVDVLKAGLLALGLITDATGDQYRTWYTHGTSHYIGIDVHDVGDTKRPLEAGMAFTIEPGLYIRQSALDTLPRTPENLAFIAKVQPAVGKYADIGVRIEDSFLLDGSGLRNLSQALPKTIADVEAFMRGSK